MFQLWARLLWDLLHSGGDFMVLYNDGNFVTNSAYPDTDFMGDADFVVADDSDLAQKIIRLYPNFDFVFDDDGNISDVLETSEPINEVISQKKSELSTECEKIIVAGVDVGDAHYSLTLEDQANILALTPLAQAGNSVFYHSDSNMCCEYSPDEFNKIVNAVTAHKTLQTTYCNLLMRQVEEMSDVEEIKSVEYGKTELIGKFKERYNEIAQHFVTQ